MTRYIDADALTIQVLKKAIDDAFLNGNTDMHRLLIQVIAHQPTIEAEPVRHGKWIKIHPQGIYECSECHQNVMTSDIDCYKFCHQCGARMDAERKEEWTK